MNEEEKKRLVELLQSLQGDLSQRQFALKLGVTNYALNNWLNEVSLPNRENLETLSNYMNISVNDLLSILRNQGISDSKNIKNATVAHNLLRDLPVTEKVRLIKLLLDDLII